MLSMDRCRGLLANAAEGLSDAEAETLRPQAEACSVLSATDIECYRQLLGDEALGLSHDEIARLCSHAEQMVDSRCGVIIDWLCHRFHGDAQHFQKRLKSVVIV